ncbi:MAG: amino acid ABC transporter ATP-binding protein [Methylococcaceae bacterium]
MIRIEHLSKRFGNLVVLKDITTEIKMGEVVSIIGASGTGKSTLLRCLNLLEYPSGGTIHINGVNILDKKADVAQLRQKMSMVFQSLNLFSHLSVLENLTIGPIKLKGMGKEAAQLKAMELLRRVGLAEKAISLPDEITCGQQQRVAIARCMAMDPQIILLDEPTSALNPTSVSEVLSVIRRLANEGMTMVIVTQEMDFAREVSNRVLYLDEGIIYEEGTPKQIFDNPQKEKTRAFIQRIYSYTCRISSPDYDLYAMNAEIETFVEKQLLPKKTRDSLLLLVEELLQVYTPYLPSIVLDLTITYWEKSERLEVVCESSGEEANPFDSDNLSDYDLGLTIIKNLTENIDYQWFNGKNRLQLLIKK